MAKKKSKNFFWLAPIVLVLLVLIVLAVFAIKFLKSAYYFNIDSIICLEQDKQEKINKTLRLKNKNILSVDLREISRTLKQLYPEISQINVYRRLPNKILIEFKEPKPVAKFKLSRKWYLIDKEAVVISASEGYDKLDLIILDGLYISFKELKIGQKLKSKNISFALDLLAQLKDSLILNRYKIYRLDISNLNKITLVINDNIEILMKKEDFGRKLNILIPLLGQLEPEFSTIGYIDLRFKDPVIKKQ
jgi:cell division septal protein FtsQ